MRLKFFSLLLGLAFLGLTINGASGSKVIMCYFGSWSTYRWGSGTFDVENIDPFLCTHLVFGFAGLDKQNYVIKSLDEYNDLEENWGRGAFKRFTGLKKFNPNLKTLLAIGGWNEGSTAYSQMARNPEYRSRFIASALEMVTKHNFDGLDLDWEYPGGRDDSPGFPDDKLYFSVLLREMRAEFDKHGLMLTAAVSASKKTVDHGYDVPVLAETLDFINLMTYDYHGWWEEHSFTGHNSPLYALPEEMNEDHPGYQFNTNFSVNYWLQKGARKDQLLVGMGAYGRGFRLNDPNQNGFYAPANGGINAGFYTGTAGFWGYNEFCERMLSEYSQWTFVRNEKVVAPYGYNGDQWFSFDDEKSIEVKSKYILDHGLAGGMVWSIDTDDFHGFCGGKKFGLIRTMATVLNGGVPTVPPQPVTTTTNGYETSTTGQPQPTTTTQSGAGHPICGTTPGFKPDPEDCKAYYICVDSGNGQWSITRQVCGPGLAFNRDLTVCDWMENVDSCNNKQVQTKSVKKVGKALYDCKETGFFTDEPCTRHFYECVYDSGYLVSYEYYCTYGTVFDLRYDVCNYPYNVPECYGPTTTHSTIRPTTSTTPTTQRPLPPSVICHRVGLNPNPYEPCSKSYYDCQLSSEGSDWKITHLTCDYGLYFDPQTLACTYKENIDECSGTTTTTTTRSTTTTTTTTTTSTTEAPSVCKYPGLNPDPSTPRDCSIYYNCKPAQGWEGHWIVTECRCDDGLAFDPTIQVCTWPSAVSDCREPSFFSLKNFLGKSSSEDCFAKKILTP